MKTTMKTKFDIEIDIDKYNDLNLSRIKQKKRIYFHKILLKISRKQRKRIYEFFFDSIPA